MLCVSTLAAAASSMYASAMSPSVNPCVVRVRSCAASPLTGPTRRYRNDPYSAKVLLSPKSLASFYNSVETASYAQPVIQPVALVPQQAFAAPLTATPLKRAAPQQSSSVSAPRYALVDFKQEAGIFLAPFRVSVGDRVIVDGDRGEHVGTVHSISTNKPVNFENSKKIVRRCTPEDLAALEAKTRREAAATRACQALVDTLGLNKVVVNDTEFQFDQQKLTIYVRRPSPKSFVDFRKLQRGLFREFRCRIWLAYMDEVEAERPILA